MHSFGTQEMKNVGQRKAVLLGECDVDTVICRSGLQFEIETAAKTFAQRQPPGFVDATTEGRMNHQLHPAGFVKETLRNNCVLGRDLAQHNAALQ